MKLFCKFPTVNISKLKFCLIICIAKNLIWTTLKAISDVQTVVSQPNIKKCNLLTGFVVQGHKCKFKGAIEWKTVFTLAQLNNNSSVHGNDTQLASDTIVSSLFKSRD